MPKISVVIPVYNAENYIAQCLESVLVQTYTNYEIVIIDDGSTDTTPNILRKYSSKKNVEVHTIKNNGQGYARNLALRQAKGEYVLFVDADDTLEAELLKKTIALAETSGADAVHFGWNLVSSDGTNKQYMSQESLLARSKLVGSECELYLTKRNYFAWDAIYNRNFLIDNNITFGEGYIYEDNEFIVGVASHARQIVFLNEPLYNFRENTGSSSRSKYDTPRHYKDFLIAIAKSQSVLVARSEHTSFYLAAYMLEKFVTYYQSRVPVKYKKIFLQRFVDAWAETVIIPPAGRSYKFLRFCLQRRVFQERRYLLFQLGLLYKAIR